jgi:hypothetical protein
MGLGLLGAMFLAMFAASPFIGEVARWERNVYNSYSKEVAGCWLLVESARAVLCPCLARVVVEPLRPQGESKDLLTCLLQICQLCLITD